MLKCNLENVNIFIFTEKTSRFEIFVVLYTCLTTLIDTYLWIKHDIWFFALIKNDVDI